MITEVLFESLGDLMAIIGDIGASVFTLAVAIAGFYTIGKIGNKCLRSKKR